MTTSAPVRKVHDIPIIEPHPIKVAPRELPQPSPERIVVPAVPIRQPVRR